MFRGRVSAVVVLLLFGCTSGPSPSLPPRSPTPEPVAHPSEPPASEATESVPAEEAIEITPIAPQRLAAPPHVEVKFPLAGKRIATNKAHDYVIRLKTSGWSEGLVLLLVLDDFTPRIVNSPEARVTLGDLVPEDSRLEPGAHQLFVTAIHPPHGSVRLDKPRSRAPFSEVEFWIGDAGASPPQATPAPRLVHIAPSGTFNGSRGKEILVDFRVLDPRGTLHEADVEVVRVSPGTAARGRVHLAAGQLAMIRELPSGDYDVTVRLLDTQGEVVSSPGGVKSRTITVNRDAPEPQSAPE